MRPATRLSESDKLHTNAATPSSYVLHLVGSSDMSQIMCEVVDSRVSFRTYRFDIGTCHIVSSHGG